MLPSLMAESISEYDLDDILAELIRLYGPTIVIGTAVYVAQQSEPHETEG